MREVTAYKCEFCKKLYLRRGMCANHEEFCLKNPLNIPLCYTCKHYKMTADTEDIKCPDILNAEEPGYNRLRVFPHRCELFGDKLYRHTDKVRENMEDALRDSGYIPMPTCKCEDYEFKNNDNEDNED